jgi:hypothetical protein
LMAFLALGDHARAKVIADAFVEAQQSDRYTNDGSLRNAYQGGDLFTAPGWVANGKTKSARLPGYMGVDANSTPQWLEDCYADSRDTGNMAWAMLSLLAYHEEVFGSQQESSYISAAKRLGDWVATNCSDSTGIGGFTGGYFGWEGYELKRTYKATEHNIDLYAAFQRLNQLTGEKIWQERADSAKRFVISMWDTNECKFWTGTTTNGITINKSAVPLDIQAWALLALRDGCKPYVKSLEYAENNVRNGGGYDFSKIPKFLPDGTTDADDNGVWYEGTSHMAAAYRLLGQYTDEPDISARRATELVAFLRTKQNTDGSLPACDRNIWTGFDLPDGSGKWYYFNRKHIGATAWLVFAETGTNPFWLGEK